jgi:two-component system, NarL family, sensor histidine kinase YdfH
MQQRFFVRAPLYWLLLLWIGIAVAAWLIGGTVQPTAPGERGVALPISLIMLVLLLVTLYCVLLWRGLSGRVPPRFFWLFFVGLELLVFIMDAVSGQSSLALNCYLVLGLCALTMYKRVVPVLIVAIISSLLVVVSHSLPFRAAAATKLAPAQGVTLGSFFDVATLVLIALGYLLAYQQQVHAQAQLEQTHQELQSAHSRLAASTRQIETLTRLTERQRMARELHDTLLQGIAGIIMQLDVTSAQMDRQHYPQAQQVLGQTISSARAALVEARRAIQDLRASTSRTDQLVASVQEEITHFFQMTGIRCHTELEDLVQTPPQHGDHVLRIIGESLSNVARHAQANQVSVVASVMEQWLEIVVRDDGRGFDPANQDLRTGHYGLLGLHERAHLVGGTLSVGSASGAGTTIRFRVPLASTDHSTLSQTPAIAPACSVEEQTYA